MFFKYAVEKYYYTKNIGDKLLAYDLNQAIIYDLLDWIFIKLTDYFL